MTHQFPGIYPKELKTGIQTDSYIQMLTAFEHYTQYPKGRSKCPSSNEWINPVWSIHMWNISQSLKGMKCQHLLQLGNIMWWNERSQTQKARYYMIPFRCLRIPGIHRRQREWWLSGNEGVGDGGDCLMIGGFLQG